MRNLVSLSAPRPQSTHLFLHFPFFWSVSDTRMIQKSSQSSLSTWPSSLCKQYKIQSPESFDLKNVIFHEKMAWIHWILKKKKSEVKFPGFYIGFLIDSQDLKMIIFNKNSYLVDTQIWLSFHLDNYNFSWITKLKEKEHSLWALWAFLVALVGYTNWRDVT
jgi:hypothetical protein